MTEQVWNFAGIEGGAGEIGSAVQRTDSLLDEGKSSLMALAAVWGGSGSEAYQAVQQRWDTTSAELNAALHESRPDCQRGRLDDGSDRSWRDQYVLSVRRCALVGGSTERDPAHRVRPNVLDR